MEKIINRVYQEVMRALASNRADTRMGIVTGYDPNAYAVTVNIMPEEVPTGWLPLGTGWTGNGFGAYFGPLPGDQVMVAHLEGDVGSGIVICRVNDISHLAPPVPGGEAWIVHKTGSFLKLLNTGDVSINSERDLIQNVGRDLVTTVGRNVSQTVTGNVNTTVNGALTEAVTGKTTMSAAEFDMTGNIVETGSIKATGDIIDQSGTNNVTVAQVRIAYDLHAHPLTGGGSTLTTDHPV